MTDRDATRICHRPAPLVSVRLIALLGVMCLYLMTGCETSAFKGTMLEDTAVDWSSDASIEQITAMYEAGDYEAAYEAGRLVGFDTYRDDRFEAAYIAGLSAQALDKLPEAEQMLRRAALSQEMSLKVDAAYALGLVYSQQERYEQAKERLFFAAERLTGEKQAQAYYYAGIAQQKLGEWSQARTTLVLARNKTTDPPLRSLLSDQIQVTGWTLQLGAFTDRNRARVLAQSVAATASNMRLGLPTLVSSQTAEGTPVTLVHVGQFTSYQSATRYRDALGQPGVIIRAMRP